jgi:hypothetical protein
MGMPSSQSTIHPTLPSSRPALTILILIRFSFVRNTHRNLTVPLSPWILHGVCYAACLPPEEQKKTGAGTRGSRALEAVEPKLNQLKLFQSVLNFFACFFHVFAETFGSAASSER